VAQAPERILIDARQGQQRRVGRRGDRRAAGVAGADQRPPQRRGDMQQVGVAQALDQPGQRLAHRLERDPRLARQGGVGDAVADVAHQQPPGVLVHPGRARGGERYLARIDQPLHRGPGHRRPR
jgi:hypothetical protein